MKKMIKILGCFVGVLSFIGVSANLSLTQTQVENYQKNGYSLMDGYSSFSACDSAKTQFNTQYSSYVRSECFSYNTQYYYFLCSKGSLCEVNGTLSSSVSQNSTTQNQTSSNVSVTSTTKIPHQAQLDKIIESLKKTGNIQTIEKFITDLGKLEKQYTHNSTILLIIGYLKSESQKVLTELQGGKEMSETEKFLCQLTGDCQKNTDSTSASSGGTTQQEVSVSQGGTTNSGVSQNTTTQIAHCDTPDITLSNGQIWSACNVGTTKSGTGVESYGDFFQWGRQKGFPYQATGFKTTATKISNYSPSTDTYDFVRGNNWDYWNNDWKTAPKSAFVFSGEGVCPTGYRIPSADDWRKAFDAIGITRSYHESDGEAVINTWVNKIQTTLLLPTAGNIWPQGQFADQGKIGAYWASNIGDHSPNRGAEYILWVQKGANDTKIWRDVANSTSQAVPVRCIKNETTSANTGGSSSQTPTSGNTTQTPKTSEPTPNQRCIFQNGIAFQNGVSQNFFTGTSCTQTPLSCTNGLIGFSEPQFSPAPPVPTVAYTTKTACETANKTNSSNSQSSTTTTNNSNSSSQTGNGIWTSQVSSGVDFSPRPGACGFTPVDGSSCDAGSGGYSCFAGNRLYTCERQGLFALHDVFGSNMLSCQTPGAYYTQRIAAVEGLKICQEFEINNPNRPNDRFSCTDDKNFVPIESVAGMKKTNQGYWEQRVGLSNSDYMVPGKYRIVIKDAKGQTQTGKWFTIASGGQFSNPNNCMTQYLKPTSLEHYLYITANPHYGFPLSFLDVSDLQKTYGTSLMTQIGNEIFRDNLLGIRQTSLGGTAASMYAKQSKTGSVPQWTGPTFTGRNPIFGNTSGYGQGDNEALFDYFRWYSGNSPWVVAFSGCGGLTDIEWKDGAKIDCSGGTYGGVAFAKLKSPRIFQTKDTLSMGNIPLDAIHIGSSGMTQSNAQVCMAVLAHPNAPNAVNANACSNVSNFKNISTTSGWKWVSARNSWDTTISADPKMYVSGVKFQLFFRNSESGKIAKGRVIEVVK